MAVIVQHKKYASSKQAEQIFIQYDCSHEVII